MPLKIVIPSHKRADKVLSKRLIINPIICVEEKQKDIYKSYNPDCEIVSHPNDVIGLPAKRNWMYKYFGDIFMIDDDVTEFHSVHLPDTNKSITDKKELYYIINKLYLVSKMLGIYVYGFTKNPRPEQYRVEKPYMLNRGITGCAYGINENSGLKWDESIPLKEDFYISLLCLYKHRKILVDNRFQFTQKDTFINQGGLSFIRNYENEKKSILLIRKTFGDSVVLKKDNTNARLKIKYNITYNISI